MYSVGNERTFGCNCSYLESEKQVNKNCRTSKKKKKEYSKKINMVKKGKELRKKKADEHTILGEGQRGLYFTENDRSI